MSGLFLTFFWSIEDGRAWLFLVRLMFGDKSDVLYRVSSKTLGNMVSLIFLQPQQLLAWKCISVWYFSSLFKTSSFVSLYGLCISIIICFMLISWSSVIDDKNSYSPPSISSFRKISLCDDIRWKISKFFLSTLILKGYIFSFLVCIFTEWSNKKHFVFIRSVSSFSKNMLFPAPPDIMISYLWLSSKTT